MNPICNSILLACLALAGCTGPLQFTSALSDSGTTSIDTRLNGRWYGREGASRDDFSLDGLMSVRPDGKDRIRIEISLRTGQRILHLTAHASDVDGKVYYNVIADPASYFRTFLEINEPPRVWLFHVEFVDDDKFFLWTSFGEGKEVAKRPALKQARRIYLTGGRHYDLVELSREVLRALVRDIGHERLLNRRFGPFFRLREPEEDVRSTLWLPDERSGCLVGADSGGGESVAWSGECRDGKSTGTGIADWKIDGRSVERFDGTMVEGLADGAGRCIRGDSAERGLAKAGNRCSLGDIAPRGSDRRGARLI